jgi:hypothetical protein
LHIVVGNKHRTGAKGRNALQRLFSTFPGGPPGVGLLLLRLTVGLTAIAAGFLYLSSPLIATLSKWSLGPALTVVGVALALGFLTPLAGVLAGLCFLGIGLRWLGLPIAGFHDTTLLGLGATITAVAIALLGPGAFSVDGYLFGRKEIVIPPATHRSQP